LLGCEVELKPTARIKKATNARRERNCFAIAIITGMCFKRLSIIEYTKPFCFAVAVVCDWYC
jgi:hypothetical protein